jgi:transcriptional regulator with XRE-family HTH domain
MGTEQAPALPDSAEFRAALADELRVLLVRKKMTQRVVAQRFGWHENAVSKRLSGEVRWDVYDLLALCYMLGTDIGTVTEAARRAAAAGSSEDDAAAL